MSLGGVADHRAPVEWLAEPLRAGARELFATLKAQGHEVWIYTASTRSLRSMRRWLRLHGIRVARVINGDEHAAAMREVRLRGTPFKYMPYLGIDLPIDDSPGVQGEGRRYGFEVLVVAPTDAEWARRVLERVAI